MPALRTDGDAVARDDDVHRARRRSAGAIDQHDAANGERLERPFAFVGFPVRGTFERFALLRARLGGESQEREADGEQASSVCHDGVC